MAGIFTKENISKRKVLLIIGLGDEGERILKKYRVERIKFYYELRVYQAFLKGGMETLNITKGFSKIEKYSLTDQIRRSSRSVSVNIVEGWRKRRYHKAFVAKLSDSESEAAETQVGLEYVFHCKYIDEQTDKKMYKQYDEIMGMIVNIIRYPEKWIFMKERGR